MPFDGSEERLHRSVARALLALHRQGRERHVGRERVAEREGQVRHRVVALGPARRPLPCLARTVRGLAELGDAAFEEVEVHTATVALGSII